MVRVKRKSGTTDERMQANKTTDPLLPHHRFMLEVESGISPEIIETRGYRSVTVAAELRRLGFARTQCRVPGLLIPLHYVSDKVANGNNRPAGYQFRPDEPRVSDKGHSIKYETPFGTRPCIDVPPTMAHLLQDPDVPLIITEGSKKADAAASQGVLCASLMGVYCFQQGSEDGKDSLPLVDWDYIKLRGRRVEIAYDSDIIVKPEVKKACTRLGALLRSRGSTVVTLYLPSGPNGEKMGLDDHLASGGTFEELRTRRPNRTATSDDLDPKLPTIRTTNRQLRHIVADSLNALVIANEPPQLYSQSGRMVRLVAVDGQMVIECFGKDALVGCLTERANFVSLSQQRGLTSVAPPDNAARTILAMADYPDLPQLDYIVGSPVVAQDGTICDQPGYNAAGQIYYHQREPLDLPNTTPTARNVKRALRLIYDELLVDFPFADDASKANTLAMLLLPFMRAKVDGPTPLHLMDAPKAGTGKSLLADVVSRVFDPNGISARSMPTDEAEVKKQLMTWLRQGSSHILLDNVKSLQSATMESVLTSRIWSDRLLGANTDGRYPNRCVWMATANNLTASREQLRRCVWIRLDAKRERPDERQDFKHPDLHLWVQQNRAALVGAALTLIRSWIEAGEPSYSGGVVMGSFEAWTRTIGGLLEAIGVEGFLANRQQFIAEADDEASELTAFVEDWWEQFRMLPVTAAKLSIIGERHFGDALSTKSPSRSLGRILAKHRDHIVAGKVIRIKSESNHGCTYRLCPVDE